MTHGDLKIIDNLYSKRGHKKIDCNSKLKRTYKVTKVRDIPGNQVESFIFGGMSSRFWIMKNFINMEQNKDLAPNMLCWNMISIKLRDQERYIDLIIEDETKMNIFI